MEVLWESQGQGSSGAVLLGSVVKTQKRREEIVTAETRAEVVGAAEDDDPVVWLTGLVQDPVQTCSHGRNDAFSRHARRVDHCRAVTMFLEESLKGDGIGMKFPALLERVYSLL